MVDKDKNHPVKAFQCGRIKAAIWKGQKVINNAIVEVHTIKIDRSYKDGEEWKHTNAFFDEDLPKVVVVANEAYKYLRMRTFTPGISQNGNNDDLQCDRDDSFPAS